MIRKKRIQKCDVKLFTRKINHYIATKYYKESSRIRDSYPVSSINTIKHRKRIETKRVTSN